MLKRILAFALEQRLLVIALAMLIAGVGLWSALRLPIDAVPDVTNVQVQINTNSPALSPLEVERQITFPIEVTMSGLPNVTEVRSLSKFGLSQVSVIFLDSVDIYFARQMVQERLQQAREEIPPGLGSPEMGPISSGLGEIYQYSVQAKSDDLTELRTLHDWSVRPQLRTVSGVAEVNTFGGFEKQYQVLVRPDALVKHNLTLRQVFEAVAANNVNKGGGYIIKASEQYVIRGVGQIQSPDQIAEIVVAAADGVPVHVRDVADVKVGTAIRQGAVTRDGKGEVVAGIVLLLKGANSRTVVEDVKGRIASVEQSLPEGTKLDTFYDRGELVGRCIRTVFGNLVEAALLVMAVLFLTMGNIRAALVVTLVIPLSMLFAASVMLQVGVAGSLMSLGAIDFGLLVDGSIVMMENSVRRISERKPGESFLHLVLDACHEVARPVLSGVVIITVVYLPILTLEGVEGKMFRPMALTVVFAMLGAQFLTFTLTPVLTSLFMRWRVSEKDSFFIRVAKRAYRPVLDGCLAHRLHVLLVAGFALAAAFLVIPMLGSEFIPRLDEGAIAMQINRLPSVSLEESVKQATLVEKRVLEAFPDEVATVVSKTGRAEIATDAEGVNTSDVLVMLKPISGWKRATGRADLESKIADELARIPGLAFGFSQPIEMRVNELIAGVKSDIGIKIFGEDMEVLRRSAADVVAAISRIPGATGFKAQQVTGLPGLEIVIEPDKIARYGINASDVMEIVEALGGIQASVVQEGQRRFDLVVRISETASRDKAAIARLLVSAPAGERVPLGSLCRIEEVEGPAEISHLNGSRLILVQGDVRGRDIGSFVDEARRLFTDGRVKLPTGYRAEFGGQFENLARARARLTIVVPASLFLIFLPPVHDV